MTIESLLRDHIKGLKPYSSARDEFQGPASVFLDANENPANSQYNRYPDPHQTELKERISRIKNVRPEQIFLGNGSDEAIDLLIRAFCEPGRDNVLIAEPTYGMYAISARINAIEVKTAGLGDDFSLDPDALTGAADNHTKLIFLCSPNNPSANLLAPSDIERLLATFMGLVVLDEAYIDFSGHKGFLPLLNEYERLVILQTLSKAWGLAGIRVGMCFAHAEIISALNTLKPPYNISSLSQSVALDALAEPTKKDDAVVEIIRQRAYLFAALSSLPCVMKVYPSDANFLLVKVVDARDTYNRLVAKGIIVRDRSTVVLCENCLRITVGTESENNMLIDTLRQL